MYNAYLCYIWLRRVTELTLTARLTSRESNVRDLRVGGARLYFEIKEKEVRVESHEQIWAHLRPRTTLKLELKLPLKPISISIDPPANNST